ncbi:MAG TPA: hypothetical protein PK522_00980 [Nitrosomonas sp.]|nr:hypothetical protein [Nitrosomonas sp.]
MADQKIELEIVLDDGSIKKAFGTIRKEAEETSKETQGMFGAFGNAGVAFVALNQGLELFAKLGDSIKGVAKEVINLSLEAEKVRATQAQFTQFTQQAGIATEQFSKEIEKSIAGLIDDDDALQIANEAMIRLGSTAQRLPQIFELARKAAAAGFGDMASNAEAFTTAIQTGQTKALKQHLGLIVDVTKAQKEYAKEAGIGVDKLNEQQRAVANANAILDAASKKFNNVDTDVKSFSESIQRLNVAIAEQGEKTAVWFDRVFGSATKGIINTLTDAINGNGAAVAAQKVKVEDLGKAIEDAEKKIISIQNNLSNARTDTQFSFLNNQLNETNKLLDALRQRQSDSQNFAALGNANDLLSKNIKLSWEKEQADASNSKLAQARAEEQMRIQQALLQSSQSFQQQEIAARQQSAQLIIDDDKRQEEMAAIHQEQINQIAINGLIARQNIETQFSNEKGFNDAQRAELRRQQIEAENAQIIASQEAFQNQSLNSFQKYSIEQQKKFQQLGSMVKITFINGIGSAFVAFGQALAKGEDAMAAFGKALLGVLGDIAIQMGQMFIWQGLGFSANPLMPGSGAGLIAAGIGLSILGGVLKGLAGGGGATGSASAGGGVAAGGPESGSFNAAAPVADTRIAPNTVVNFTVQGDILDSDSTQTRIVQLLNDAIDTKGAVVRGL